MQESEKSFYQTCCEKINLGMKWLMSQAKKGGALCTSVFHRVTGKAREWMDFKQQKKELYASWEEEAKKGNQEACYKLMMLYFDETEEYYPLAFKWTEHIACTVPDCAAMLQLAKMYDEGIGTPRNQEQALTWYEHCLSLHIIRGKNSPLSIDAANFVQQRIQTLRARKSAN